MSLIPILRFYFVPKITVPEFGTFEIDQGKRLVLALEDNGVDISHRCGGNAQCTTCRVVFTEGEPENMTEAEKSLLQSKIEGGEESAKLVRLSCQIIVNQDMSIEPQMLVSKMDWDEPGKRPEEKVTPPPVWGSKLSSS